MLLGWRSNARLAMELQYHHWHRLVKNIGGKPKYWRQKMVMIKTGKCRGVSQLLGGVCARAAPKVYASEYHTQFIRGFMPTCLIEKA